MDVVYHIFHGLCHQMPERALSAGGFSMPLCARCAGLYIGLLVALPYLLYRALTEPLAVTKPVIAAAAAAAVLFAADGVANAVGLWDTPKALRFGTGIALGAALSPLVSVLFATTAGIARARPAGAPLFAALAVASAALTAANLAGSPSLLIVESYAAAAGALLFLGVIHTALLVLVLTPRRMLVAAVVAVFTVSGQLALLSGVRTLFGF